MSDDEPLKPLLMPELGLPDGSVRLGLWLVEEGERVVAGDRLVELSSDGVTVDLSAPAGGVLTRIMVEEEELLTPGQTLAWIEVDEETDEE